MSTAIYRKLQEHLDTLPIGFPRTESGVEITILKRLFEPEEAEMAARLSMTPETVEDFCRRTGLESETAGEMLERMSKKGQIFRLKQDGELLYCAASFIPGIWEYQLNNLDSEFVKMVEQYFKEGIGKVVLSRKTPVFRVVPVDENISQEMEVMPYDRVKEIIRTQDTIAVADCICRKEMRLAGHGCDHLGEACLLFSHLAHYYVENGLGRFVDVEEAIDILDRADKDGLVHSPANAQQSMGICNCCGCCCGTLRGITRVKLPPSKVVKSDYYCVVDSEACIGCGDCTERCPVGAIELADEIAGVNRDQCIGCGLCVSSCPSEALRLQRKPAEKIIEPPPSYGEVFEHLKDL